VLQVGWPEAGAFDPEEVELVEALAHQAAIAIQNARLIEALARSREEIRRRARAEQALREIATRITAIRDPGDLLQQVVDASRQLLDADRAQLDLVQPDSDLIRWSHVSGADDFGLPLPGTFGGTPVDRGINGPAIAQRRAIVTADYLNDERFVHVPESDAFVRSLGIRAVVAVPLFTSDGLLGVLKVATTRLDAFDDEDAALMEAFADQAVVAIQNARLIEELDHSRAAASRQADAERALRMIAADISAIRDPDELLQQTVDEARRLLESDTARIDMLDGTTLTWTYASGEQAIATRNAGGDTKVEVGQGVTGIAVANGHAFRTGDYLADTRFTHTPESDALVDELALHSVLAAPLRGESGVLGALTVSSHRNDAYDASAEALLQALADQAAITIQNARLIAELNASRTVLRKRAEAEQALREIAARISATKGARDVLQRTVDEAARLLDADEARIDLIDAESGLLRWAYHSATTTPTGTWDWPDAADESLDQGVSGRAVLERRVAFTGDYLNDPSFLHSSGPDGFVEEVGINSVMSAPLLGEAGRPFGALTIYTRRRNAWADEDARLIEAIATQAAIAITNARLIEELDRSTSELARRADAEQSLREIAARITAIREPGPLLQQVVDAARRLVGGDGSILDLVDPVHNELRFAYDSGVRDGFDDDEIAELTIPIGIGATGLAVAEDRVIIATGDLTGQFPDAPINDRFFEVTGFRSMIVAPVTGESGPLGAIEVYSSRDDAFDDRDAGVIRSLAYQAAIAIQNARLIEELERSQTALAYRAETERSLRDITARITSLRDPGEILSRVVEESRRLLGSDGAHLTRIAEDGTYLVPVIVAGETDASTEEWLKTMEFPLGGGINGLAAEEVRPVWTSDYTTDPRIPHEADDNVIAERLGLRSMAAAPLRAPAGEVIGTLAISYREPREFVPDELDLLQGLADQAAIALTNSNLYELLGESEARYRHLVQNSPDLVWSIDAEARFTFVSDTCERLTGWRPEDLLGKHFGALVHPSSTDVAQIDWTAGMTAEFQELRGRLNLLHRDGHPIPAEFSAFGTLDPSGSFAGANGSVRDMSAQDRLERELRESEERYRFLVENSPDIIYAVDASGTFTYVSETIRRALGYDPDDLVGTPFSRIIHYDTPGSEGLRFAQIRADPTLEITSRLQLIHADGHLVPFEVSAVGVVRDGEFAGIHGSGRDVVERERLERELRESEARYRFLVENSPDIIFSIDPLGRLSYISDSSVAITGRPPEESVGRLFVDFVAPDDVALAAATWDDLHAEPGNARTIRIRLLNAAGLASPYEVSMVGIADENGRFLGVQGTSRDIRERERLERELRESEERYRFLVENSPDIIFSTDAEGLYTYYSETVEGLTGYKAAELIGSHFGSIVDLDTFPESAEAWQRFVAHPTRMQVNRFSLRTRDDRRVPVEVSAIGMTDEQGRFAGIHGSARDIRERERLEGELRASEERYRYLVKASPDVVWAVDGDGLITFMSDRIEELAGYQPDEIVGKHFVEMTDPASLSGTDATWNAVRRDPTGVYPLKLQLRRRAGDPIPVEIWVTGMVREGEFAGAHGSIRDMREREGYERDLRRQAAELASSQERAHLARELHDSVTQALFSMTLVTRTTELLVDRDPAAAKEKLGSLRDLQREALAEMRALIFELRPGNIEQDGLLPALKTHSAALQGRIGLPIVVTSDLTDRLPLALEEVLYRISQEALHNVVKHAAARQVTLSIDRVPDGVRLRIADDGRGFDAAAVPDGHLGLAGMRARAAKIGAELTVTAEAGKGTTIEVLVPAAEIAAAGASTHRADASSAE
jgi:PAS domain S-box-containing protein